jgi:6-phosphogluconolactonase (cycloisomerase 2 family)
MDPLGRFAFVANGGGVSPYKLSATTPGALDPVGLVAAGGIPNSIAVDPTGRFVYVASQVSNGVSQYSINATTGALTALAPSFVATAVAPLGIGIDPSGRNLYVVGAGATSNVLGFTIGANGTLSAFASGPVPAGTDPRAITFDAAGRFAYVTNQTSNDVTVFQVAANGVLSLPVAAATQGSQTWTAAVEPSGKFAYAVNQGSGDVTLFRVNQTDGSLSRQGSVAARFSPGSIAFTRGTSPVSYTPHFAYTANLGSNDVSAFQINSTSGAPTLITNPPISSGGAKPFPVAADPSGRFLYVGHEGIDAASTTVAAFTINASSGALTAAGIPVQTGGINADGLTVDPSGRFVYVGNVNVASNSVSAFAITLSTGALIAVGAPSGTGGQQPFSPVVDPSGRFLYTANFASANVSGFRIDPATGALSALIPSQTFALTNAQSPFALVVSPSARFVYVANFIDPNSVTGTGNISVFAINLASGALSEIGGSPYPTGPSPRSIAIHPSGRFLYVGNEATNSTVTAYQADPSTGVLSQITGSPFAVGGALRPITVDPSGRFLYVGRTGSASVSAFAIDPTTGALVLPEIGGAPVPTGNGVTTGISPFTITTTGSIQ